jgi:hypothetical protein
MAVQTLSVRIAPRLEPERARVPNPHEPPRLPWPHPARPGPLRSDPLRLSFQAPSLPSSIHQVLQFLAAFEKRQLLGLDDNFFTGLRVPASIGFVIFDIKRTKPSDLRPTTPPSSSNMTLKKISTTRADSTLAVNWRSQIATSNFQIHLLSVQT